jgi:hypothetical protein
MLQAATDLSATLAPGLLPAAAFSFTENTAPTACTEPSQHDWSL